MNDFSPWFVRRPRSAILFGAQVLPDHFLPSSVQLADGGVVTGKKLHIHGCPVVVNLQSLPSEYDFGTSIDELLVVGCDADIDESEMSIKEELPE